MPTFVPPKKNTAYTFYLSLISQANTKLAQANPTLAAGDVKVATDDGVPANLGTLPVVDADFTKRVKVALSSAEMNGDNVTVIFSDAAGAEWCDLTVNIQTAARQIDDLAFPVVSGRGVDVDATGGVEITPNQAVNAAQWAGAATATDDVALATAPTNFAALAITAAGLVDITQAAADKVWASATRTLTAFSTALALAVWDVLETAIAVASSIGLKVKTNLDATVSSRAPEAGGNVAAIKAKTDQLVFTIANKVDASIQAAGDFAQAAADKVWASATRTLTSFGTLVADIWANATRTLTGSVGIKKNAALPAFEFVMYDSANTPTAGLTVSGQRSIDGGAFAPTANSPTEVSSGVYKIDLAATDLNGDVVTFRFTALGAVDTLVTIKTVHA